MKIFSGLTDKEKEAAIDILLELYIKVKVISKTELKARSGVRKKAFEFCLAKKLIKEEKAGRKTIIELNKKGKEICASPDISKAHKKSKKSVKKKTPAKPAVKKKSVKQIKSDSDMLMMQVSSDRFERLEQNVINLEVKLDEINEKFEAMSDIIADFFRNNVVNREKPINEVFPEIIVTEISDDMKDNFAEVLHIADKDMPAVEPLVVEVSEEEKTNVFDEIINDISVAEPQEPIKVDLPDEEITNPENIKTYNSVDSKEVTRQWLGDEEIDDYKKFDDC